MLADQQQVVVCCHGRHQPEAFELTPGPDLNVETIVEPSFYDPLITPIFVKAYGVDFHPSSPPIACHHRWSRKCS
jgi:hypothetical protein